MKKIFCVLSAVFLSLVGSVGVADSTTNASSSEELGVLLIGDQGQGNAGQAAVANALQTFCSTQRCDFGFLLGDNFYPAGVRSVEDSKFQTYFEEPYGKLGLLFWTLLGNHDYGFGWARGNVQAQIDYTTKSRFWRMPSRYYSFVEKGVEFVVLDTVKLRNDSEQLSWLDRVLSAPKSGFRMVLGHYPVHSGGLHGDTPYLRDDVAPKFCPSVDAYVAGHDHHLEYLKSDCGVPLVVSGAGAESRPVVKTPRTVFSASTLGFAYLKKTSDGQMFIQYFDDALNLLAEFSLNRR